MADEAMAHPPFTFSDVPYEEGVLEAVGYIGGTEAVRDKRRSPHAACALRIETDEFPVDFESGGDAVFVYVSVVDTNGTVMYSDSSVITLEAEGEAQIIGESSKKAEAGVSAFLILSGEKTGTVRLVAKSQHGFEAKLSMTIK